MKSNKTLMMAALIAGGVFAADVAAHAQDATNPPPAGTRPPGGPGARGGRMNFDNLARQLALTDDQKTKARPIFDEMQQKMRDLANDINVQGPDRAAKQKGIQDAATAKLKEIPLSPEQVDKWQNLIQRPARRQPSPLPPVGGNPPQQ